MRLLPGKDSLCLCLFGLTLIATTDAEAGNLLVNGDFATGLSGWTFVDSNPGQDVVFWTSAIGTPPHEGGTSGGSLNMTAVPNGTVTASQCVVTGAGTIDARVLIFPFVAAGPSSAQIVAFGSHDCGGVSLGTISLVSSGPVVNTWNTYQALAAPLPPGTNSVRFELAASDGANQSTGDYLFDDAQLDSPIIFVDGFESAPGAPAN